MNQPYLRQKNLAPTLQALIRPTLLISLGLHGLLLMIPIQDGFKKVKPPQEEKEETVKISELLVPTVKFSPKPSPKPFQIASTPTPKKAAPNPQQKVVPPIPALTPKPTPTQALMPKATPTPEASPTPALVPEATSTPTSDAEAGEEFEDVFGQVSGEVSEELGIEPNYFEQPELFFTQESLAAGSEP